MVDSIPCPSCGEAITVEDFGDFSTPFTMKCPHCQAKLKETKVTPIIILSLIVVIPLFIYMAETVRKFVGGMIPLVDKLPSMVVFILFLFPIYKLYEKGTALLLFNKGNVQLKKNQ